VNASKDILCSSGGTGLGGGEVLTVATASPSRQNAAVDAQPRCKGVANGWKSIQKFSRFHISSNFLTHA